MNHYCERDDHYTSNNEKLNIVLRTFIDDKELQKELMRSAILEELRHKVSLKMINNGNRYKEFNYAEDLDIVPYNSVEEFLAINPNCCSVKTMSMEREDLIEPCDLSGSIFSLSKNSCVYLRYKIRYRDQNNTLKLRESWDHTSVVVSKCGKPSNWSAYRLIG